MRLIDADEMAMQESEAYMKVNAREDVSPITLGINSVVHRKLQQLIADTPTIDAVERKRGKWINSEDGRFMCSNCEQVKVSHGMMQFFLSTDRWHFCPNCGADMRGEPDADHHD